VVLVAEIDACFDAIENEISRGARGVQKSRISAPAELHRERNVSSEQLRNLIAPKCRNWIVRGSNKINGYSVAVD